MFSSEDDDENDEDHNETSKLSADKAPSQEDNQDKETDLSQNQDPNNTIGMKSAEEISPDSPIMNEDEEFGDIDRSLITGSIDEEEKSDNAEAKKPKLKKPDIDLPDIEVRDVNDNDIGDIDTTNDKILEESDVTPSDSPDENVLTKEDGNYSDEDIYESLFNSEETAEDDDNLDNIDWGDDQAAQDNENTIDLFSDNLEFIDDQSPDETPSSEASQDIFTETDTSSANKSQKTSENIEEKEALDPEFLAQIDTPNDLFIPDERHIGQLEVMTKPTEASTGKSEDAVRDELFPTIEEKDIDATNKALAEKNNHDQTDPFDINATNEALSPKHDFKKEDDILFEENNLLSDLVDNETVTSDIAPIDKMDQDDLTFPIIHENNPNLRKPRLLQDTKELSAEEKISITPFTSMQAGSAICRFEHVIDAHKMSEQFRLTVLPPNGMVPLKMETIKDLSLDKFLTMKMDEVDGYPDEFSSLSVFCKEMTISKRLIENY